MTTGQGGIPSGSNGQNNQAEMDEIKKQLAQYSDGAQQNQRIVQEMEDRGPGYRAVAQGDQEKQAGVLPPGYEGTRDVMTGDLLDKYKSDAYGGEALQKLKEQAFADPGDSPWARMQLQQQGREEALGKDNAAKSQAQAMAQAQGNLMRQGGLSGGARLRMAQQGIDNTAKAQQNVASQGIDKRMGIQSGAIDQQSDLLGRFGNAEQAANEANIGRSTDDVMKSGLFDMERYKQQMASYGAQQSANAQRAASSGGGKK